MSRGKLQNVVTSLGSTFEEVGGRIRQCRGNLSAKAFGALLGVSDATVIRWEQGRLPNEIMLQRIALLGKRDYPWLLSGRTSKEAERKVYETLARDPAISSKGAKAGTSPAILPFPDPMAGLTPKQKRLVERVMALLDDEKTARHLAGQIDLLEEALENMERKKGIK